jgi:hypothetical protein
LTPTACVATRRLLRHSAFKKRLSLALIRVLAPCWLAAGG